MARGRDDGTVVVAGERQRLFDARGYGRPVGGDDVELAPIEAAHLLSRGDLDDVDGRGFAAFVEAQPGDFAARFIVYDDLRSRGYYLSVDRPGWVDDPAGADFLVYERGSGPRDGAVAFRVRVIGERSAVPAASLGSVVLAVVDEEGEVTYFETDRIDLGGASDGAVPAAAGVLLDNRVFVWDPPAALHDRAFYGQPIGSDGAAGALQLSLVEAAHLARSGALSVDGGASAVIDRGRAVEGERFDRRLAVYSALRDRGAVPKTGFKFGADFRVYSAVESVEALGHSEHLVQVVTPDVAFSPRELALEVRLAGGVKKRLVFALATDDVEWLAVGRLTP